MNLKKIATITTAMILMTSFSYGQNDEIIIENSDSLKIKRINIGLKIGIPNIVGGSAEITLGKAIFQQGLTATCKDPLK